MEEKETAMFREKLFKLAMDAGALDQKDAKQSGGVATGKGELNGSLPEINDIKVSPNAKDGGVETTNLNKPQGFKETKKINSKVDPKDTTLEKEAFDKLALHAGKIVKGLALAGGGAAAGAHVMKKKKEKDRGKELRKIKYLNTMENKTIRKHLAKKFKTYNDKENKALAKHFYAAGKRESGK